ncbi:MAG: M14-type cytosolic carboxypeptidase [Candidatus Sumerlaeia bacterium]|nr:M14-type cytosolic carboxypeptidase [Candidatus Sumerlaeia bacterium]
MTYRIVLATLCGIIYLAMAVPAGEQPTTSPITFNTNFESGSLGKIEVLGETHFRCAVRGECNFMGRNRQASWYYFRMDNVRDREITLELTDLVGEYNNKPGAIAVREGTLPVFSYDNQTWQHFESSGWDKENSRLILRFRPARDTIWIAHIQPYTTRDLDRLLDSLRGSPYLRTEVIGKSAGGRDLLLLTVTDFAQPDAAKKSVWLMARQHSWETGGSFACEGALRFILSDAPEARQLRERVVFKFLPMADPDGVVRGGVRFNANGYDVNRHWDEVDLRDPKMLERMPEIWYLKKAIVHYARAEKPIDLLVYLHNEESNDWISAPPVEDAVFARRVQRFFDLLMAETMFDGKKGPVSRPDSLSGTSYALYQAAKVPAVLMELKVMRNERLGRYPTAADRLEFGKGLIRCMARAVLEE